MTDTTDVPVVLSAVDDMFFSSRIESAAKLAGVRVVSATDARQLAELLLELIPRMIILDLNSNACAPLESLRRIKADGRLSQTPVIGFVSHVQRDLADEARRAGCDQVMPRSVFTANLPKILASAK